MFNRLSKQNTGDSSGSNMINRKLLSKQNTGDTVVDMNHVVDEEEPTKEQLKQLKHQQQLDATREKLTSAAGGSIDAGSFRVPLQWRGYSWRRLKQWGSKTKTSLPFNRTPLTLPSPSSVDPVKGNTPKSIGNALSSHGKLIKSRVTVHKCCRFMKTLLMCTLVGVLIAFVFAQIYQDVHTVEPCLKAERVQLELASPRMDGKGKVLNGLKFPKIIHQQWKTDTVPEGKYTEWHEAWVALYPEPEFTHMLWTDTNGRELIQQDYPFFLKTYDNYKFGIQRADAVRYFVLHKYGGIYADLDYEPLVNFWDHLPKDRVSLIESPYKYNEEVQNSLMAGPIGDPFWNTTFKVLMEKGDEPVLKATGPMFLDAMITRNEEPYHMLPCENFQRMPFVQEEGEVSPFISRLHRNVLGRLMPMKYCGEFKDMSCQFGKHHNTASYLAETGILNLIWT